MLLLFCKVSIKLFLIKESFFVWYETGGETLEKWGKEISCQIFSVSNLTLLIGMLLFSGI